MSQASQYCQKNLQSNEIFLVECLAWGVLQAHRIQTSPVPVHQMIQNPLPVFGDLALLELSLGLYAATYRSGLNGSRLIVVDPTLPNEIQRASIARELYVAYCRTRRAMEIDWPCIQSPHTYSNLFARCLLMPAAWVQAMSPTEISPDKLAARFKVPVPMAIQRLKEIARYYTHSDTGESLAQALFSLDEPWRSRFLGLVVQRTRSTTSSLHELTPMEVASWLNEDQNLYQDIKYLVNTWQKIEIRG